jgi:hypothetical protein
MRSCSANSGGGCWQRARPISLAAPDRKERCSPVCALPCAVNRLPGATRAEDPAPPRLGHGRWRSWHVCRPQAVWPGTSAAYPGNVRISSSALCEGGCAMLSACSPIADHYRPRRHRLAAATYRQTRAERFATRRASHRHLGTSLSREPLQPHHAPNTSASPGPTYPDNTPSSYHSWASRWVPLVVQADFPRPLQRISPAHRGPMGLRSHRRVGSVALPRSPSPCALADRVSKKGYLTMPGQPPGPDTSGQGMEGPPAPSLVAADRTMTRQGRGGRWVDHGSSLSSWRWQ